MSICLIVIDMVNDYLGKMSETDRSRIIEATNELIKSFRAADRPVIWVRQEFEPDLTDAFPEMRAKGIAITIRGTHGAAIHSALNYHPHDAIIIKKRYSAFFRTELALLWQVGGTILNRR
jgi:nicotinamidase-related amidase